MIEGILLHLCRPRKLKLAATCLHSITVQERVDWELAHNLEPNDIIYKIKFFFFCATSYIGIEYSRYLSIVIVSIAVCSCHWKWGTYKEYMMHVRIILLKICIIYIYIYENMWRMMWILGRYFPFLNLCDKFSLKYYKIFYPVDSLPKFFCHWCNYNLYGQWISEIGWGFYYPKSFYFS